MRSCSVGSPYTRYTQYGTRDNYTRYPEYETTTRRRHNTSQTTQQDHNILIEFHLTTPLHVFSDLHFAYSHGHGRFSSWLRSRFTQGVLLFGLRLILGPNACADHSGRARSLHQIGLCIRRRRFSDCFGNPLQLSLMDSPFLFRYGSRQGVLTESVYTERLMEL